MTILLPKKPDILSSEITPESVFYTRRKIIKAAVLTPFLLSAGSLLAGESKSAGLLAEIASEREGAAKYLSSAVSIRQPWLGNAAEPLTPFSDVSRYNNFYEFGTGKDEPINNAQDFNVDDPWSIKIEGEVERPGTYTLEDVLKSVDIEERIYRFRCVEAWSMVVPWVGFSLGQWLNQYKPTSKAKYVSFETLYDPKQMVGQRSVVGSIPWPYIEGLRIDEAMNPLSFIAVGLYGRTLPPQNGAPLRLVVPWKYGFKSIKSIVGIKFTEKQPKTTWQNLAPKEYGFYANVNPGADHPRWSQGRERRLPVSLWSPSWVDTLPFNGYQKEVASLYSGMDLIKHI